MTIPISSPAQPLLLETSPRNLFVSYRYLPKSGWLALFLLESEFADGEFEGSVVGLWGCWGRVGVGRLRLSEELLWDWEGGSSERDEVLWCLVRGLTSDGLGLGLILGLAWTNLGKGYSLLVVSRNLN